MIARGDVLVAGRAKSPRWGPTCPSRPRHGSHRGGRPRADARFRRLPHPRLLGGRPPGRVGAPAGRRPGRRGAPRGRGDSRHRAGGAGGDPQAARGRPAVAARSDAQGRHHHGGGEERLRPHARGRAEDAARHLARGPGMARNRRAHGTAGKRDRRRPGGIHPHGRAGNASRNMA